jgi:PAT family beta-lactamase induction signal transducer AmpG
LCILLFAAIALCAATHDMAADGLFIRSLPAEAQPRYLGWLSVAFNAGKLTAQGLLVVVVGRISLWRGAHFAWQVAFGILAAITAGLALYHRHALPNDEPVSPAPRSLRHMRTTTAQVVMSFFTNRRNAALLALIVVYRLAEGQVVRIAPLFLMDSRQVGGLGLTTSQLGVIYGGLGGIMVALGALMGGSLATRIGERRAVIPLCLCFNVPALVYLLLAGLAPSLPVIAAAIVLEQMAYGVGSIGLKLAVLSAAKGPYETAHCAFAGGLAGIGAIVAGMLSGTVQSTLGYLGFFAWALVAAGAPLIVAWICYRREA